MNLQPVPSPYRADCKIASLGEKIGDPAQAADFPKAILRYRNDRWAASVGLDSLSDEQWISNFGRFEPLPNNMPQPLALRYHGHQFRVYNPDIGDGRGFLFAQMRDHQGRLMDLGTKGSGQTPYSRDGDGRLTLKGAVREILATEMLEALGVETSKTFSVIETGEALWRGDEPSPTRSAVLVRLSHSHIRIGAFQRMAFEDNGEGIAALVRYCLEHLYNVEPGENAPVRLMNLAVERIADQAASYMVAGFVHGVLNSDNINITGESFDYGPWRFSEFWDPAFTAAYFDHHGLYAFGRQAEAMHWNLAQLAISLRLICDAPPLVEALERFPALYQAAIIRRFLWRLGQPSQGEEADRALVEAAERTMISEKIPIELYFRKGRERAGAPPVPACSMLIDEVETIWSAIGERDDWQPFTRKIDEIRAMGAALRTSAP
jgi:serine/tyrosine/threonine adenylyltransferase